MGVQLFVDAPTPNPTGFRNNYYTKNFSIITSDTVYSDTLSWHLFSGSFIADSSYRYFAVGNFFSRDSLTWFCRDPLSYYVYTFFDNFCLSPDSALCLDSGKSKNNSSFNLYYDNSSQTLHIGSQEEINNLNIKIYSLLGQRLIESVLNGNTIAINLSSGVYFAILNNQLYKFIVL